MSRDKMLEDYRSLSDLLASVKVEAEAFHASLKQRPVAARYDPKVPPSPLPQEGAGAKSALDRATKEILPGFSASPGPRYLGFVTGGVTPAALLGDWLVSAVDQNAANAGDSLSGRVNREALSWLKELFGLPAEEFDGCFTTGATASNLLSILCAREWAGEQIGKSPAEFGLQALPPLQVFSATPHASFIKVMAITGQGRKTIKPVACLPGTEAMDPEDLEKKLSAAGDGPKMVVASAATVTGNDFDDLPLIAEICRKGKAWLHVDAAFGIFARCLASHAEMAAGLALADSITGDGHKWLNVPYDCGFFFTRRPDLLERSCGVEAVYLKTDSDEVAQMNRTVEDSQRFRGFPVWMTLAAYGAEGVKDVVRNCCRQAEALAHWVEASPHFELLAPLKLNVVVFRALPANPSEDGKLFNEALLKRLNQGGKVRMTPGAFGGRHGLRAAFSNWMTEDEDVPIVTEALEAARRSLVAAED